MLVLYNQVDGVGVCCSHDCCVHIDVQRYSCLHSRVVEGCKLVLPVVVACPISALEMNHYILLRLLSGDFLLFGLPSLQCFVSVLPMVLSLHQCHVFQ